MQPEIAILIPHYNNLEGLYKSLASISNETEVDVVVVDDGSREKPVLNELKSSFPLVHDFQLILLNKNQGIEHALNAGLKFIHGSAKYKYVARLDSGDTNAPERFRKQKEFLDRNEAVYLISNYADIHDTAGKFLYRCELPLTHAEMQRVVYIKDPIFHASSMFRVKALDTLGYYPTNYKYCEDTAYFYKFIKNYKTANIAAVLYYCEQNPNGISLSRYRTQKLSRIRFSLHTFTLRYPIAWLTGISKNIVCFILGPNLSIAIALKLNKIGL